MMSGLTAVSEDAPEKAMLLVTAWASASFKSIAPCVKQDRGTVPNEFLSLQAKV